MSLTFYFAPMSTATITEGVLAELGTPCERVQLDLRAGDTKKPEFLKINPNGKVPTIVHDGTPIWESAAITMYLGETFGVDAKLYPGPGRERGQAMAWINWANVTVASAGIRLAASLATGGEAADRAKADVATCLQILEGALAGKSFLLGDYTLVDTHVYSVVAWLGMMKVDFSPYPGVAAWMKRCGERPALAKLLGA